MLGTLIAFLREVLETAVPPAAAGPGCAAFLESLLAALADAGLAGRELYVETPPGGDDRAVLEAIAAAQARWAGPDGVFLRVGAKLRCGGLAAAAFPAPERLAQVIATAGGLDLALKFTAGLHHPVRRRVADPEVTMHGFLNVLGAAILVAAGRLGGDDLVACLTETEADAFTFGEDRFSWRGHAAGTAAVARARAGRVPGFGSCSFREPRDDLAALGLL
ncbi:MAG: hypothetical protein ABR506_11990 [Candidatus Krumholzibacteriia bacterium]